MKRILIALAFVLAGTPALAQSTIFRPLTSYTVVATSATDTSSARTLLAGTRIARAVCNVSCFVAFSASPYVVGTTVASFLPANTPEYFRVTPGTVVSVSSDVTGRLYITEAE